MAGLAAWSTGVPGRRPRPLRRDAERNRARILDAAREVFRQRGFDATLDDVAAHAGLGVATVYRHEAPELWRRYLRLLPDGLRAADGSPSPLPVPALDPDALDRAMAAWRHPRS